MESLCQIDVPKLKRREALVTRFHSPWRKWLIASKVIMCAINSLLECYGRMLHLTQRYKAQCEKQSSTLEVRLAYCFSVLWSKNSWFLIWDSIGAHVLKSKLCTEQFVLQVCDMRHYSLLLHNFDPGYRNKIMLQNEERDAEGKYNTPCPMGNTIFKSNWIVLKTGVLRHATSHTEYKSTCVVDMCLIGKISCPGIAK